VPSKVIFVLKGNSISFLKAILNLDETWIDLANAIINKMQRNKFHELYVKDM